MRSISQLLKPPRPTLLSKEEAHTLAALARSKLRKRLLINEPPAHDIYDETLIDE